VIELIEEENLAANAAATGGHLRARLEELREKHPLIGDVRGMGLMQAVELVRDRETREPAPRETALVLEAARENGILIGKGGIFGNVIRISPPLNVGCGDVDEFSRRFDRALAQAAV
jgi:4-aminobutyrate aminotransferase-like enzyme